MTGRPRVEHNDQDDPPRPFLEHLEDLRATVLKSGFALILCTVLSFIFIRQIFHFLQKPLVFAGLDPQVFLKNLAPVGGFTTALQMAFMAGLVLSLPLILYFIAEFVLPGLTKAEKRIVVPVFSAGALLFLCGVAFAYFVMIPVTLRFFYEFDQSLGFTSEWTVQNYISFVLQLLLVMGVVFELPILIFTLAALGLVDSHKLATYRRHAIVAIVISAAVITPTSDLVTLTLMSLPMWLLYEICIIVTRLLEQRAAKNDEHNYRFE